MKTKKTTKRERKFAAKGGVQARLEKGGAIAPKGKAFKRKRKGATAAHDVEKKKAKRDAQHADKYTREQHAERNAEDFLGKDNASGIGSSVGATGAALMDIGSFFATLEDELKKEERQEEEPSSNEDEEEALSDAKVQKGDNKKSEKSVKDDDIDSSSSEESGDDDEGGDDDDSGDVDNEDAKTPKKRGNKQPSEKASLTKKRKESSNQPVDSSDSDDEDPEAAEARMVAEMNKLQKDDPEFHEFLQENEQELLEFGQHDDGDDEESNQNKEKSSSGDGNVLTARVLHNLERGAFGARGIQSLKRLVQAYKSACHVVGGNDEDADGNKKKKDKGKTYEIESSAVFDQLMSVSLRRCHEAFRYHLLLSEDEKQASVDQDKRKRKKYSTSKSGTKMQKKDEKAENEEEEEEDANGGELVGPGEGDDDDDKPLDPKVLERSYRWTDIKPVLNSFLKSTLHLLTESKEPELLAVVLKAVSNYLRFMTPFPRLAENLLKTLTDLWSAPLGDESEDYQVVRLNAFLRIRQLALTQPFSFVEDCLKKTYLAYARRAKFSGTASSVMNNTLPTLTFMGNCLVELYSLDYHSSYQHAFIYIRQLALFLRTAMQKKTAESFQNVFCWQFLHCLKLWAAVLAAACKTTPVAEDVHNQVSQQQLMRSLIFPLTEVIMGTVRLAPAPTRHLPLRFHCVRLLQQLASASETYIPTVSMMLEVLDLKELSMKPKKINSRGATTSGVHFPFLLKLPKDEPLRTAEEQEACMSEVFKLLNREVDLYRYSAGFPEFSMQLAQRLRKFNKETRNNRWRAYSRGCMDLCERYSESAMNARSKLKEPPKDVQHLECLRTPVEPSMGERYEASIQSENKELSSLTMGPASRSKISAGVASSDKPDQPDKQVDEATTKTAKKRKRKQKHKKQPVGVMMDEDAAMAAEDEVAEGVDWSSEDEN